MFNGPNSYIENDFSNEKKKDSKFCKYAPFLHIYKRHLCEKYYIFTKVYFIFSKVYYIFTKVYYTKAYLQYFLFRKKNHLNALVGSFGPV